MSIAALWTGQPATLIGTSSMLGIALPEVCTFYSAACVIGLVVPSLNAVSEAPLAQAVAVS